MRADKFFADRFGSRTKAREALLRGLVLCGGKPLSPKNDVTGEESFIILDDDSSFVSMGGDKLERALACFHADVFGKTIADLGSSTGGFCDCLLRRGAKKVFCVDVGRSQLAPSLASDPRVVVMDGVNARYLTIDNFSEQIDVVTADLSFISLKLVLPAVFGLLGEFGRAFVLFKPQFECGGVGLGKSGILPLSRHASILREFYLFADALGFGVLDIVNAPIRPKKNVEYVISLEKGAASLSVDEFLRRAADFTREP